MYEQKLDIQFKIEHTKAQIIRRKIRKIELEQNYNDPNISELDKLCLEAELIDFKAGEGMLELALSGAEKELNTIKTIMDELEPYRKYSHLPLLEATEAAQQDEWREEFKHRIENYLITQGTIPEDQIRAMRNHPDFETNLVPHIRQVTQALEKQNDKLNMLKNHNVMLLEMKNDT